MVTKKLYSVQYLRAVAALAVVFHHARNPTPGLYNPFSSLQLGQAGVDIFFVLSGFIMFTAARNERVLEFARRRFIRIVPLYWLALAATLLLQYRREIINSPTAFLTPLVKSALFIPYYSDIYPGEIWPILVPGWTLNYEIFFYFIFGISLIWKNSVAVTSAVLISLIGAGLVTTFKSAIWLTYTDPILLEFLAGIYIARWRGVFAHTLVIALLPLGLSLIAASEAWEAPRLISWGIPAMAIVIGALALEDTGRLPKVDWLCRLGDASFSIYILHLFAINVFSRKIVDALGVSGHAQFLALMSLSTISSIILGLLSFRFIERPMNKRFLGLKGALVRTSSD